VEFSGGSMYSFPSESGAEQRNNCSRGPTANREESATDTALNAIGLK